MGGRVSFWRPKLLHTCIFGTSLGIMPFSPRPLSPPEMPRTFSQDSRLISWHHISRYHTILFPECQKCSDNTPLIVVSSLTTICFSLPWMPKIFSQDSTYYVAKSHDMTSCPSLLQSSRAQLHGLVRHECFGRNEHRPQEYHSSDSLCIGPGKPFHIHVQDMCNSHHRMLGVMRKLVVVCRKTHKNGRRALILPREDAWDVEHRLDHSQFGGLEEPCHSGKCQPVR